MLHTGKALMVLPAPLVGELASLRGGNKEIVTIKHNSRQRLEFQKASSAKEQP